jgi:hypothetical protein
MAMPTYCFHITGPTGHHDEQEVELEDDRSAWEEALRACGDILGDTFQRLRPGVQLEIGVEAEGQKIYGLKLVTDGSDVSPRYNDLYAEMEQADEATTASSTSGHALNE